MSNGTCVIDDCGDAVMARDWCAFHYGRWHQHGDPLAGPARRKRRPPKPRAPRKICSVDTCPDPVKAHGWCSFHRDRAVKYGNPLGGPPRRRRPGDPKPECNAPDCTEDTRTLGLCPRHYQKLYKDGDALAPDKYTRRGAPLAERIMAKTDRTGECWLWLGFLNEDGYGVIGVSSGKTASAHRVSYEVFVGPIPDGLEIDHLCRVRACVRPNHLEAVTHAVNIQRADYSNRRKAS